MRLQILYKMFTRKIYQSFYLNMTQCLRPDYDVLRTIKNADFIFKHVNRPLRRRYFTGRITQALADVDKC